MPRYRNKNITAIYAGRVIFDPTAQFNTIADIQYEFSRNYTTGTESILDSDAPIIRAFGNATGAFPFAVCYDFASEEEAFSFLLELFAFTDSNQTGTFSFTAGETTVSYSAGLSGITARLEKPPAGYRVTANFAFILAAKIN